MKTYKFWVKLLCILAVVQFANAGDNRKTNPWEEYYQTYNIYTNPREVLMFSLTKIKGKDFKYAIDLGAGEGISSEYLMKQGWKVLAIDGSEIFEKYMAKRFERSSMPMPRILKKSFEELTEKDFLDENGKKPKLIIAENSLPYCQPKYFNQVWNVLINSLESGSIIYCNLFGDKHGWAKNQSDTIVFLNEGQVRKLFDGFYINIWGEEDDLSDTVSGNKVHWHSFTVMATKE